MLLYSLIFLLISFLLICSFFLSFLSFLCSPCMSNRTTSSSSFSFTLSMFHIPFLLFIYLLIFLPFFHCYFFFFFFFFGIYTSSLLFSSLFISQFFLFLICGPLLRALNERWARSSKALALQDSTQLAGKSRPACRQMIPTLLSSPASVAHTFVCQNASRWWILMRRGDRDE